MALLPASLAVAACVMLACGSDEAEDGRFEPNSFDSHSGDGGRTKGKGSDGDGGHDAESASSTTLSNETPDDSEAPAPSTTCRSPRDLGAISGDTTSAAVRASGTCSQWLRVRVTENDTNPLGYPMTLRATLASPTGDDFDLYVYLNKDSDVLECSTPAASSQLPAARSDVVQLQWGEYWTANRSDDSRTVSIEVRHKSEGCAKVPWALIVEGNQYPSK